MFSRLTTRRLRTARWQYRTPCPGDYRICRPLATSGEERKEAQLVRNPSLSAPPHAVTQHGLLAQLDITTFSETELRQKFADLDRNGDGFLSREEVAGFFKTEGEADVVFKKWDDNRDGCSE